MKRVAVAPRPRPRPEAERAPATSSDVTAADVTAVPEPVPVPELPPAVPPLATSAPGLGAMLRGIVSATASPADPPKRGPGRPRKHPLPGAPAPADARAEAFRSPVGRRLLAVAYGAPFGVVASLVKCEEVRLSPSEREEGAEALAEFLIAYPEIIGKHLPAVMLGIVALGHGVAAHARYREVTQTREAEKRRKTVPEKTPSA